MDGVLSGNVLIDSRRAEALLFPIVAFLRVSGLTKEAIERACRELINEPQKVPIPEK